MSGSHYSPQVVLAREERALEFFARGSTYESIGIAIGRLDGRGALTREAVRRLVFVALSQRHLASYGGPHYVARAACALYLACRRADEIARARMLSASP